MQKMIFITGFARGGTSWLRDCVASHPEIKALPREQTIFTQTSSKEKILAHFDELTKDFQDIKHIVNKAPANAPMLGNMARMFPESKFIFIIRDPRDVFVSHKRGNQKWMRGRNSSVGGCMKKSQKYYSGWESAAELENVILIRYEDLHQNFFSAMSRVFEFIGVATKESELETIYSQNNFSARTGRSNIENRDSAKRKGVIGDWVNHLTDREKKWYEKSPYWQKFMSDHHYDDKPVTYENIVLAMKEAGVNFLCEQDLLERRLEKDRPNIVLQHDIDYLNKPWCKNSVKLTAEIEAKIDVPAIYYFLPLDDSRYNWALFSGALKLISELKTINSKASIGLHLNACEKFYPAQAPDTESSPENLAKILDYTKKQIHAYKDNGITFRTSTAHGYGRGKKLPNNRDTPELTEVLEGEGIALFDTTIRPELIERATAYAALTDVGGTLKPRRLPGGWSLVDANLYASLPAGSFVRYLTHPGNYPVDKPAALAMRLVNRSLNAC